MKMFGHKYRYLFIVMLGVYSYLNTLFIETFRYYGIDAPSIYILLTFVLVCAFVWEGNRLLDGLFFRNFDRRNKPVGYLLFFFAGSQVVAAITGFIVFLLIGWLVLRHGIANNILELKLIVLFSFRINLFLHCINAIVFFLNQFRQKQLETEELQRINTQAQLQSIRSQVNPHFLFNNLNVLASLVMQKSEDANKFIEEFSKVYRYILNSQEREMVKLEAELEFIRPYLYLLSTRFGEGLEVQLDIPDRYKEMFIVPVALQLLIENAIKHNVISKKRPLHIRIYVDQDDYLVVENNLQEKPEKEISTQIGLQNINQRFKLLHGQEIRINKNHETFVVAIPLIELKTA